MSPTVFKAQGYRFFFSREESRMHVHAICEEVTNISAHGPWLLTEGRELFLPFDEFPWFRDVPVKAILNVEEPTPGHFYWPDLDVDLTAEIIEHPERFPLCAGGA